jgi:plastocyanin
MNDSDLVNQKPDITPALTDEYTIKEISDPAGDKTYYFLPEELTLQPGNTVTFVDAQEEWIITR